MVGIWIIFFGGFGFVMLNALVDACGEHDQDQDANYADQNVRRTTVAISEQFANPGIACLANGAAVGGLAALAVRHCGRAVVAGLVRLVEAFEAISAIVLVIARFAVAQAGLAPVNVAARCGWISKVSRLAYRASPETISAAVRVALLEALINVWGIIRCCKEVVLGTTLAAKKVFAFSAVGATIPTCECSNGV